MSRALLTVLLMFSLIIVACAAPKPSHTKAAADKVVQATTSTTRTGICVWPFCGWNTNILTVDPNWRNGGWRSIYYG